MSWFGKGCIYQVNQWEREEVLGNPDYMETEPVLTFCNHRFNPEDTEGNCREHICPIVNFANLLYPEVEYEDVQ